MRSAIIVAFVASGCSSVLWYGRDSDREHDLRVERSSYGDRLIVDGVRGGAYEFIAIEGLRARGDRIVYPALRGGRWHLVENGVAGHGWRGIGEIALGPNGSAFAATDGRSWFVVHERRPSRAWDAVLEGSLRIAGDRAVYVAELAGKQHAVVGDRISAPFDAIGSLAIDEDASRILFAGRRGDTVVVTIGDRESEPYDSVAGVVIAPGGGRYAYLARREGVWRLIADGTEIARAAKIGMPLFSPDGARLAYVAGNDRGVSLFSDELHSARYDFIRQRSVAFDPSSQHLSFVGARAGREHAVLDGTEGPAFDEVDDPVVVGSHWAYLGHRSGATTLMIDGAPARELEGAVRGTLVLGEQGSWACITARPQHMFVTIDGREAAELDLEEISALLLHSASGRAEPLDQTLRAWAEVELRRTRSAN